MASVNNDILGWGKYARGGSSGMYSNPVVVTSFRVIGTDMKDGTGRDHLG